MKKEEFLFWGEEIGLPGEALQEVGALFSQVKQEEIGEMRKLLKKEQGSKTSFYEAVFKKDNPYLFFLFYYLYFGFEAETVYRKQGFSEEVFQDTFRDIAIWAKTCKRRKSVWGIDEYDWFWRHLEGRIVRLGRLQYELLKSPWEIKGIQKGEPVYSVHIPEGEPLEEEKCRKSFVLAETCLEKLPFVCHSWLLYPGLKEVLRDTSNILEFQKFFEVVKLVDEREAEERIFGEVKENPEDYPENTLLQREAKKYLLHGGKLGDGIGIYIKTA